MKTKHTKAIESKRPVKIVVHFNKFQAEHGLPWTVHIRGVCIPASRVLWDNTKLETIYQPEKKSNPRGWIECVGRVLLENDDAVRIV